MSQVKLTRIDAHERKLSSKYFFLMIMYLFLDIIRKIVIIPNSEYYMSCAQDQQVLLWKLGEDEYNFKFDEQLHWSSFIYFL